nr:hypothetical transcript [Hymenolepis microstoma]
MSPLTFSLIIRLIPVIYYFNFSESLDVKSNLLLKDDEEEGGLRVICNGSDRFTVTWPNPPEVQYGYYTVEVEEALQTKGTYKPIELEFIGLLPFTNYTISVYDYYDIHHEHYLGRAFAHTLPEVRNLSPCQHYSISVKTCARDYDCGPATTTQVFTLPEAIKELRINQISSTRVNLIWKPQDLKACALANITVIIQERSTLNFSGRCFVPTSDIIANQCTTGNLKPNTEYKAFAIACSKKTFNCAARSEDVEFTTLPDAPQCFQAMIITSQSAEFRWNRSSGRQDGIDGYLVRIYETSTGGELNHKLPISNCSIPAINDIYSCNLGNLKPSTNYSATVAAFKFSSNIAKTFGDESEEIFFTTDPPFPITAVVLSLLALFLIILIVFAVMFRQRIHRITCGNDHKQDEFDISKSDWWKMEVIPKDSISIEYFKPLSLNYLLQIPSPVPLEKFNTCVTSLIANKQFVPHFMFLKQLSLNGMQKEFRLTKEVGAICKERNRYVDMLPYDQSLVLLGRPWPFVLDYPESTITVTDALNGYINASYVRSPEYGSKGEALPCGSLEVPEFIATQGPLENTTFDFLNMIYEQRSKLIIMLCG